MGEIRFMSIEQVCETCGHTEVHHRETRINSVPAIYCYACAREVMRAEVDNHGEAAYDHCAHNFKPVAIEDQASELKPEPIITGTTPVANAPSTSSDVREALVQAQREILRLKYGLPAIHNTVNELIEAVRHSAAYGERTYDRDHLDNYIEYVLGALAYVPAEWAESEEPSRLEAEGTPSVRERDVAEIQIPVQEDSPDVEEAREAFRRFSFGRLRTTWDEREWENALDQFQRVIEAKQQAHIEALTTHLERVQNIGNDLLMRAERAEERIEQLEGALRELEFEVEKTSTWRQATGMRPATDTSAFATVPPSGLNAIRRVLRGAALHGTSSQ